MKKIALLISVLCCAVLNASVDRYQFYADNRKPVTEHLNIITTFSSNPLNQQPHIDNGKSICVLSMDPVIERIFKSGIRGIHKINRKFFLMGTGYEASEAIKKGFPTQWRPSRILNSYKTLDLIFFRKTMAYFCTPHRKLGLSQNLPTYILSSMISTCTDMPEQDWPYLRFMNVAHFKVTEINFISTLKQSQDFAFQLSQSRVQHVLFGPNTFGRDHTEYTSGRQPRLFDFIKRSPRHLFKTFDIIISVIPLSAYINDLINQVLLSSIKETRLRFSDFHALKIINVFETVSQVWSDSVVINKIGDQQPIHINILGFFDHLQNTSLSDLYINEFTHIIFFPKPFKVLKQFTYRSDNKFISGTNIVEMCRRHFEKGRLQQIYQKNCIADEFLNVSTPYCESHISQIKYSQALQISDCFMANRMFTINTNKLRNGIRKSGIVHLDFINNE